MRGHPARRRRRKNEPRHYRARRLACGIRIGPPHPGGLVSACWGASERSAFGILVSCGHGLRLPATCNNSRNWAMLHLVGAIALLERKLLVLLAASAQVHHRIQVRHGNRDHRYHRPFAGRFAARCRGGAATRFERGAGIPLAGPRRGYGFDPARRGEGPLTPVPSPARGEGNAFATVATYPLSPGGRGLG